MSAAKKKQNWKRSLQGLFWPEMKKKSEGKMFIFKNSK